MTSLIQKSAVLAGVILPVMGDAAPLKVSATNLLKMDRPSQTIELSAVELVPLGEIDFARIHVKDSAGSELLCQGVDADGDPLRKPDAVIFQADFGPGETKTFTVFAGGKQVFKKEQFKAFGRFNHERFEDFAWENDRIAHRTYGKALETWKGEPLTSSTIDIWSKRTPRMVVNDWYLADDYHVDHGEGADFYSAGLSRGCGGSGLWADDKLWVSSNFVNSRVLANGPIRVMFELEYEPCEVAGAMVSETKRVSLDAGHQFDRYQSRYQTENPARLAPAVGLKKVSGERVDLAPGKGWLAKWERMENNAGQQGLAVIVPAGSFAKHVEDSLNHLVVMPPTSDQAAIWWAGFAWDKAGHFTSSDAWKRHVEEYAQGLPRRLKSTFLPLNERSVFQTMTPILKKPITSCMAATVSLLLIGTATVGESQPACFASWPAEASPAKVGKRLAENFVRRNLRHELEPAKVREGVIYPEVITWYGALEVAGLTGDKDLLGRLVEKFEPYLCEPRSKFINPSPHVDYRVFGMLPLEIHQQTGDKRCLELGKRFADAQWENTTPDGITTEARYWIDDMYMIPALQVQAFRSTKDRKYLDRAALTMCAYLDRLHKDNGLFFHGENSPFYWGRGNGWIAAGAAELLKDLPEDHPCRERLMAGYRKMMNGLLGYQTESGLWRQLIDRKDSWEETSGSAMFAFGMVTGVKRGWLDQESYGPAARKAWLALVEKLDEGANLREVCIGTNKGFDEAFYLGRPRTSGDLHGQAPMLWTAAALLR